MDTKESVDQVNKAISELADAALPVVRRVVEVLQVNVDQMSGTGKELLDVVQRNAESVVRAGSRLASSGVQLAASLAETRTTESGTERLRPTEPRPPHQ